MAFVLGVPLTGVFGAVGQGGEWQILAFIFGFLDDVIDLRHEGCHLVLSERKRDLTVNKVYFALL